MRSSGSKRPFLSSKLTGAGKWMLVAITTSAAVLGLVANARNLGLTTWLSSQGVSFADLAVRRVVVRPARDSLFAIGDTLELAATVTDSRGAVLTGASLSWKSQNPVVASVDSSGAVVARGAGSTLIVAAVRDLSTRSLITVRQRVAAVAILDTLVRVPEGGAVRLAAAALDARGNPIVDRTARWISLDTAVVATDSLGIANGRAPGRTTVVATLEGYEDRVAVEVTVAPATLVLVGGDAQRATAGRQLALPVVVEVRSRSGRPVEGVFPRFATADDGGGVAPAAPATDRAGRARVSWTLSKTPGRQRLVVSLDGLDTLVTVTAEADPIPAATRVEVINQELRGPAGGLLDVAVLIRVSDTLGVALVDLPVSWVVAGAGEIEAVAPRTDSLGEARARWTLGPRSGLQRARVQVGSPRAMAPVTISALALPAGPATLTVLSGNGQDAVVGAALKLPVVVRVADAIGNPVPDVSISATPSTGTVIAPAATDSAGRAAVRWTLGRVAGDVRLDVRTAERGLTARVRARARPAAAANVEFVAPAGAVLAGRTLSLSAHVTDAYGNGVPETLAVFNAAAGTVAPARVMTDAKGVATTRWTLGAKAGEQALTAAIRGTAVHATLTIIARSPR